LNQDRADNPENKADGSALNNGIGIGIVVEGKQVASTTNKWSWAKADAKVLA
jgi:hypothetical protein